MALRLAQLGEFGLIDMLRRDAPQGSRVRVGIGDDTAVVTASAGTEWLLTCDVLAEGIHFRRRWYHGCPAMLGRKALAVNLSDIASMGGRPRYALVTVAAGQDVAPEWLRQVYDGLYALAREWQVDVVGGDTSGLPAAYQDGLVLDVFLTGEVTAGRALLRSGAQPGDVIAVTGQFGLARAGLALLDDHAADGSRLLAAALPDEVRLAAVSRQLDAPVRLRQAWAAAETGLVRAMSDTSDGLANQVHHICRASGVGATLDAGAVPIGPAVRAVAPLWGADPLAWALWGGEDYELMLTVAPGDFAAVRDAVAHAAGQDSPGVLTPIGHVVDQGTIALVHPDGRAEPLAFGGWEHFSRAGDAR